MPDFCMCNDQDCPSRENCYRNPASGTKPGYCQSWAMFDRKPDADKCEYYEVSWQKKEPTQ